MIKKLCILCLITQSVLFKSCLYSQVNPLDRVIDTVRCHDGAGQSYALYLPPHYDNKKKWPVILIFDPSARGKTGVIAFTGAGRKYGFILACSNNSRNGPMSDNFTAAEAMITDIGARFTLDQKRIFAAGFSGGSRFAAAYAVKNTRIAGVIGCGAGLPNDRTYLPTGSTAFLYYGLVGTRDMNYLEMYDLQEYLGSRTKVISYLQVFPGGHEWPGQDLLTDAVEWMILQTMNLKIVQSDQKYLSYMENKTQRLISLQENSGNPYDAARYIRCAIRDFNGTRFASGMAGLLTDYLNSPKYKTAARKWDKMAEKEQESRETYIIYLGNILRSGQVPDTAITWWKKETGSLKRIRDKSSSENSQMSSRILNFISILCYEQGISLYRNRHFELAAFMFNICTYSDSENQINYYNLAKSLAGSGRKKEAVDALTEAVRHGFSSRQTTESEPAFSNIRDNSRYKDLVNKMK